jgi:hypothetical protein
MATDWDWMGSEDPDVTSGLLTIRSRERSISFEMESFQRAYSLINLLREIEHDSNNELLERVKDDISSLINKKHNNDL